MKTSVIGYPRIGALRELKFATEQYFKGNIKEEELQGLAEQLRLRHWSQQKENGIDYIPVGDFSFYDNMLDTAVLLNVIPERYADLQLPPLDEYFAMARGYQGENGDVKALAMKKWFNTNYHYIVPEIDDQTVITLAGSKLFDEFVEAQRAGITAKPVVIGPFTFLKLATYKGSLTAADYRTSIAEAYRDILGRLTGLGAEWIQFDEPALVTDLTKEDIALFTQLYQDILIAKGTAKIVLQTYFGDIRDGYPEVISLDFDGIGLDFVEGLQSVELIERHGFPQDKVLFAGLVNGKNIWRNNYKQTLQIVGQLQQAGRHIVIGTSCSLLHVPYTVENETKLDEVYKKQFAFAEEKLGELADLQRLTAAEHADADPAYKANSDLFATARHGSNAAVRDKVGALTEADFTRLPSFADRESIQRDALKLPNLPTTTIGSFPQTADVKANRAKFKKGELTEQAYTDFNRSKIAACIALQENIGLDVLVHGEYERNDMVEYFGESLDGYLFTQKAWVQSYGTRCVKPPVVWGDISRSKPITVDYSVYAQSLTVQPVKGMLTGPVTILNWSFPREDISLRETALQIALAIREEVLDLEANGIRIIQIDEAALREKLPLRRSDWHREYLDWAIPAFRLVHSGVKAETQIHTHMCYSEFTDIITDIDAMDADVISFEASRSDLTLIDALHANHFMTQVGPGVYDIHSPRIPDTDELKGAINQILQKVDAAKLWINPDCGLKTRGEAETVASLEHLVAATQAIRSQL